MEGVFVGWQDIGKAPLLKSQRSLLNYDEFISCSSCFELFTKKFFAEHQNICLRCNKHFHIKARDRLGYFLDSNSFIEYDQDLVSSDFLSFVDTKKYSHRLNEAQSKFQLKDAVISGEGSLDNIPVQVAVFDFCFMGGSMGSVVGEKIARALIRSYKKKQTAIIFSSSGGARMQEGLMSLMQMAKTCAALSLLKKEGVPFISVLTHPTTGGVAASYASLGDINIAEPNALIGFAGPRVIKQTLGEDLPKGFQTAEYLHQHGMIDLICTRTKIRKLMIDLLKILVA